MNTWYVAINGQQQGPFPQSHIQQLLASGVYGRDTLVWREGFQNWLPISQVPELNQEGGFSTQPPPAMSGTQAHEIDFEIFGTEMQFVEVELDPDESAVAAPYPGKIIPLELKQYNGKLICQKEAFLCAAKGVAIGVEFQKKIGTALFGGEGFVMQKLEGDGLIFVHAGGTIIEKELQAGQTLKVDTGCLVALTQTVDFDIEFVGGIKSAIFGGEGFFFATVRGPGHVWLQSLPFSRLAGRIHQAAPQNKAGFSTKDEGSVLGGLGNLFEDKKLHRQGRWSFLSSVFA